MGIVHRNSTDHRELRFLMLLAASQSALSALLCSSSPGVCCSRISHQSMRFPHISLRLSPVKLRLRFGVSLRCPLLRSLWLVVVETGGHLCCIYSPHRNSENEALHKCIIVIAMCMGCGCIIPYCLLDIHQICVSIQFQCCRCLWTTRHDIPEFTTIIAKNTAECSMFI